MLRVNIPYLRYDNETDDQYQKRIEYYSVIGDMAEKICDKHVIYIPTNGDVHLNIYTIVDRIKCYAKLEIIKLNPAYEDLEKCTYNVVAQKCKELNRIDVGFIPHGIHGASKTIKFSGKKK